MDAELQGRFELTSARCVLGKAAKVRVKAF